MNTGRVVQASKVAVKTSEPISEIVPIRKEDRPVVAHVDEYDAETDGLYDNVACTD